MTQPSTPAQVEPKNPFRYWIGEHALQQFQHRFPEFKSMSKDVAAKYLDDRVHDALSSKRYNVVVDKSAAHENTLIVDVVFGRQRGSAVMRHRIPGFGGHVAGPDTPGLGLVTMLTQQMAADSFASGRWRASPTTLASALTTAQLLAPAATAVETPAPPRRVVPSESTEEVKVHAEAVAKLDKPARGGTITERRSFVREVLAEDVNLSIKNINARVLQKFGTGMGGGLIQEYRREFVRELTAAEVKATIAPPPAPAPVDLSRSALAHVMPGAPPPRSKSVAEQLMDAITAEGRAREAHRMLDAAATAAAAQARASAVALENATAEVERCLAAVAQSRSE